jgi:GNAT superfamily N-acetyltransferase
MSTIEYSEGGTELLDIVGPLWKKLTVHHAGISACFGDEFRSMSFVDRKADLLEKGSIGTLHIVLAKATRPEQYVGYGIGAVTPQKTGEIESLFVEDDFRGRKIGSELVGRLVDWMDKEKVVSKSVPVAVGNEEAYNFYKQWGFYPRVTTLVQKPQ